MSLHNIQSYSRYVALMKLILPFGILLSLGVAIGWPYFQSLGKENLTIVDTTHPNIQENRMLHPHYVSTDNKGQPFQVDADWAKQRTDNLADLANPHGSMTMREGETFNLGAKKGIYNSQEKVLNLEGQVILTSTDGYHVQTEKARVTIDNKIIEGDDYIEGEGPTGEIRGQKGFKVETLPEGKVITLKGPARVVIHKSTLKNDKGSHAAFHEAN